MSIVRPFKAVRPNDEVYDKVASLPYDVMNREEAKKLAEGNELSFLHVVRSEIDLPDSVSAYDESVYEKAKENLYNFIENGTMLQDEKPMYYIYRQIMDGRVQTGLVATTSIDEYMNNKIKKHELTREKKEKDRINNFYYTNANTAPIFLTYRYNETIDAIMNQWIKFNKPINSFISKDNITHYIWKIDRDDVIETIRTEFEKIDSLYIADGHHRSASSAKVGLKKREEEGNHSDAEYNYFMSVLFSDKDLFIMDYNRVVKDLNGLTSDEFMKAIKNDFDVNEVKEPYKPCSKYHYGMLLDGKWYELVAKKNIIPDDIVGSLDISVLQNNLLDKILGIKDPRTDDRIDFIGGIRGLKGLEERVNKDMKVAFSMYPTTMDELLSVADNNLIMPPKSTWFEPKLRSGLFVHLLK